MNRAALYWRTVRYLKTRQVVYQTWHRLRRRPVLPLPKSDLRTCFLTVPEASKPVSWQAGSFTFLNQTASFGHQIDWNYRHADTSKLWTYNLNYFDFLNQPGVSPDAGLHLIRDFIAHTDSLRDGLEAYPTSLRIGNWVQFLSRYQIQDDRINTHLFAQIQLLRQRLEYHLGGNHLLENGFALLVGALYFQHERLFRMAAKLIRTELTTQILADGGHDERSPMYHQILLDRLLDTLLALRHDTWHTDPSFTAFLTEKATQMLGWLETITFRNGDIPLVNDAAFGVAPTTAQLRLKAIRMLSQIPYRPVRRVGRKVSGYRMFRQDRYELFADVGPIGPNHQPGHAHADTLSFVLYVDNQPVLVDSGTSTYQPGQRRSWERSTAAHNTVEVANTNSSEVWAGFRVGRRARVMVMKNTKTALTARHNGYRHLGILHQRSWSVEPINLIIVDRLLNVEKETLSGKVGVARFHFHPGIEVLVRDDSVVAGPTQIVFKSATKPDLCITNYTMTDGFNRLQPGQCLEATFLNSLKTTITLRNENTIPDVLFRA